MKPQQIKTSENRPGNRFHGRNTSFTRETGSSRRLFAIRAGNSIPAGWE
jgi:hypothetical protein